jgi:hypothetical protein
MDRVTLRTRLRVAGTAVGLIIACFSAPAAPVPRFGRVSGNVTDPQGNALVGATVLLTGPIVPGSQTLDAITERVITDAHGKFSVEHVVPGWYSVKATSPARLPLLRSGVKVESGFTTKQNFVLTDIFSSLRFQPPPGDVSFWGEDWKWVLRTSASTRPILRYRDSRRAERDGKDSKARKKPVLASQRLIGMMPGSSSHAPLSGDPGLGSVMAYFRPLSDDADVLVAGSMTASGSIGSSVATAFRRNLAKGDPLQVSIAVHQLNFAGALPVPGNQTGPNLTNAQGLVVTYTNTRRLSDSITVTTGLQIDYLNAFRQAMVAQPQANLEYHATSSTSIAVGYGTATDGGDSTLLERVGELSSFPQVSLRGYRPALESLDHGEVKLEHRFGKSSQIQVAAYHDAFRNAAVWGSGNLDELRWLAGAALPNPAAQGLTVNAGDYRSSGVRAAYAVRLGSSVEAAVLYAVGDALSAREALTARPADLQAALRTASSQSVGGKLALRVPGSKTLLTTSYLYLPHHRITSVDPYGQARVGMHPYLNLQVRQPLPNIAFIPAHIEALADFRNLLEQGYVPVFGAGEDPLLLSAAYRSFRGGFSVQF